MPDFVPFRPSNFRLDKPPACTNLFLHARDTSNVGDLNSTPFDYFTLRGQSSVADFWSAVNAGEDRFDNIVVGGGVFSKNYVRTPAYYERLQPKANLILWGVGTDAPGIPPMPEDFTRRCSLIGTRDFGAASLDARNILFCPCASAMNRAFDVPRPPPSHAAVQFLHHNKKVSLENICQEFPAMHNYECFTDALDFLASGDVVITNSYHGLYWATLLGRKVICHTSTGKFAHFKWRPAYVNPEAGREAFREAVAASGEIHAYPDALAECRALNMAFYWKVLAITGSGVTAD